MNSPAATRSRSKTAPDAGEAHALEQVRAAFASSVDAVREGWRLGLNPEAEIRTTAPALLLDTPADMKVRDLDDAITAEKIDRLSADGYALTVAIREALVEAELERYGPLVTATALDAWKLVYKALSLSDEDYVAPRAVITIATGSPEQDSLFNTPWGRILAGNPHLHELSIGVASLPGYRPFVHANADLRTRSRFQTREAFAFQLWSRLSRLRPARFSRGTILVGRHNSLVRETAAALAADGYRIHALPAPPNPPADLSETVTTRAALAAVSTVFRDACLPWLAPLARTALTACFEAMVAARVAAFDVAQSGWEARLNRIDGPPVRALASNILVGPVWLALREACRMAGIPVVQFQHGHSREIASTHKYLTCLCEEASSDLLITYSARAADASANHTFAVARTAPAGLPAEYYTARRYRRARAGDPDILFASTSFATAHIQATIAASWSDRRKTEHERAWMREVLTRLPYSVLYKPYPTVRYVDDDGVTAIAAASDNVTVEATGQDLRYLLPNCRIIVTERATSTIGWCLAADKPLIYVDLEGQYRLQDELRPLFEDALFLFDETDGDAFERVRTFLARPLEEIEADWAAKCDARKTLLEEVFGFTGRGAGRRATTHIEALIGERARRDG